MAIKKISIDSSETNIKQYVCLPTDEVSTYPIDCGIGSTMTVIPTGEMEISVLEFDGVEWVSQRELFNIKDITDYHKPIQIVVEDVPTILLDVEYQAIKNFTIDFDLLDSPQVETATIVGTISTAGDCTVTITSALYEVPKVVSVALDLDDTASIVAEKIRVALSTELDGDFVVSGEDADVVLTAVIVVENDTTLNIAYDNDSCVGLTADSTSTSTSASGVSNKSFIFGKVPTRCEVKLEAKSVAETTLLFGDSVTFKDLESVTLTANTLSIFGFVTRDGGTSWIGKELY